MGRMRTMKPEFFKSRSLAKVSPEARLTFIGMWTEADDRGNGIADERLLKGAIWPLDDDVKPLHISAHVRMLVETGHIELYEVAGETYFHIINFDRHQAASYRRGEAKYPPVSAGQKVEKHLAREGVQESASCTPKSAGTGNEEQGTKNREQDLAIAAAPAAREPDLFDAFWSNYPRKDNKAQARKAWPKACKRLPAERLVRAAEVWAGWWEEVGMDRQHIPHPSTWLNNDRWNDERPTRPRGSAPARESTTDQRVAAVLALARPQQPQLPGAAS